MLVTFEMNQSVNIVLCDEHRTRAGAMPLKPRADRVGDADVERAVAAAGEHVNVVHAAG